MDLSLGGFDRPVTIQQLADSVGTSGRPVETWTTLLSNVWMKREDVTRTYSGERFMGSQLAAQSTVKWTMRFDDRMDPEAVDVEKKRRLVYLGRVYDITVAMQIGRQDWIELTTIAGSRVDEA